MRERAMAPGDEVPHQSSEDKPPEQDRYEGIDGWMNAVRGFFVLILGLLLVSIFTVV
ncbi:hypothetical protein [Roseococcus pinisoli]|uniref:Aa3-type cytochrome c oxidase subunit IV n=1 Tax=Roseococcus pinisoli TaxID=2835040 RepID=A0ABS5QGA4_9PROT|nr:hypothetical protein [Roseococcus pinisoli]MBS7812408.1 hypothetical protein [Roseococcus pinisoli]